MSFENSAVGLLTESDFQDGECWKLKKEECCFVLFYVDWCGHCQKFKPEYTQFAQVCQFMKCYAVDGEASRSLLDKMNGSGKMEVRGFPTLYIYAHGSPKELYAGQRDMKSLLEKAGDVCKADCKCGN